MTDSTHSTNVPVAAKPVVLPSSERITTLANIVENLTKPRMHEDESLAEQANWLAIQIDEVRDNLSEVILIAGIGADLSQRHIEDDDTLGEELFFLFGEIAEAAIEGQKRRSAN